MKNFKYIILLVLSGCGTPYIYGGAGYALESGDYGFSETGTTGVYGLGMEYKHGRCEYHHRSMAFRSPEVVINDIQCVVIWRIK